MPQLLPSGVFRSTSWVLAMTLYRLSIVVAISFLLASLASAEATHPYPGGVDADLWILAGQSNMVGAQPLAVPEATDPRVMSFTLDGEWVVAQHPLHRVFEASAPVYRNFFKMTPEQWADGKAKSKAGASGAGVGPGLDFAKRVAEALDRPIGLIPCALGATSMNDWDPALLDRGEESLYGNMIHRARQVGGRIRGVLWYQGEADVSNAEAVLAYEQKMLNLIDRIRLDLDAPELPFIFAQVSRYVYSEDLGATWERGREIQRGLPAKRPHVYMVPTIDLPLSDLIHVSAEGQRRVGMRMADVALNYVYQVPGRATPIDFASAEVMPAISPYQQPVRVRFSGVNGRLVANGRLWGFETRAVEGNTKPLPKPWAVELDPEHGDCVILWLNAPVEEPVDLYYGAGMNPYVNLTDERDMAVPAFGPVRVGPGGSG